MQDKRPNVLLITLDECRADALGCFGNSNAVTPNIDAMAKDSICFENSFVSFPKCVPSRFSILTGRYPHSEGHRTLPGFTIRPGENNLALELKNAGYCTALIGKSNHTMDAEFIPDCFNYSDFMISGADVPWEKRADEDESFFRAFYRGEFCEKEQMLDTSVTTETVDFIKNIDETPVFAMVNLNNPHPPYFDVRPFIDEIRAKKIPLPGIEDLENAPEVLKIYRELYHLEDLASDDWRKVVEAYASMVSYADECVGEIVSALKDKGLYESTIIVLTSDHGDFAGEHGCVEKWDTMFYDCLIKVPLIISVPGMRHFASSAMVENVDLVPTILELCGFGKPWWVQGRSFVDVLTGKTLKHKDKVFCEGGVELQALQNSVHYDSDEHSFRHPNYYWKQMIMIDHPVTILRAKMIRTEKWKLIFRVDGDILLYDIENDAQEIYNLSNRHEYDTIIHELILDLLKWEIETETCYPHIEKMYS